VNLPKQTDINETPHHILPQINQHFYNDVWNDKRKHSNISSILRVYCGV